MKRRAITLLVAGLLAHAVSSTARASEVQGSIQIGGGPLIATGLPEFSVSGMGVIGFGVAWPVSDAIRIGLRQELAFTTIAYGNYDGEPLIGKKGENYDILEWAPTFIPSTTLWLKLEASARVSIDASLGVALMASSPLGFFYSFLPVPSGGVGLELLLSDDKAFPWRLRAQCDTLVHVWHKERFVLFLPALEAVYSF
jgi:hypothetical protein